MKEYVFWGQQHTQNRFRLWTQKPLNLQNKKAAHEFTYRPPRPLTLALSHAPSQQLLDYERRMAAPHAASPAVPARRGDAHGHAVAGSGGARGAPGDAGARGDVRRRG